MSVFCHLLSDLRCNFYTGWIDWGKDHKIACRRRLFHVGKTLFYVIIQKNKNLPVYSRLCVTDKKKHNLIQFDAVLKFDNIPWFSISFFPTNRYCWNRIKREESQYTHSFESYRVTRTIPAVNLFNQFFINLYLTISSCLVIEISIIVRPCHNKKNWVVICHFKH